MKKCLISIPFVFHDSLFIAFFILLVLPFAGRSEDKAASPKAEATIKRTDWEIVRHEGRDYVAADNILEFYSFKKIEKHADSVILSDSRLDMKLERNGSKIWIKKVLYHTAFTMISKEDTLLISTVDLTKLIDPVLRPSYIKGIDSAAEFLFLFDDKDRGKREIFENALGNAFSGIGIPMQSLISSSEEERANWMKKKSTAHGARIIVFRFDVPDIPENGVRTKVIAPVGAAFKKFGNSLSYLASSANRFDGESIALATAVHSHMIRNQDRKNDLGISRTMDTEMQNINCPAILVEFGDFKSHVNDSGRTAYAIASGTKRYLKAVTRTKSKPTPPE